MAMLAHIDVFTVSVVIFIALIVVQQLVHGRMAAELRAARDEAQAEAKQARAEVAEALSNAEKRVREAIDQVDSARGSLDAAVRLAEKEKRRADAQFGVIEDIKAERDQIWRRYRDMSASAGHAQDVLFTELERLLKVFNARAHKYGFERFELKKDLVSALRQFNQLHGQDDAVIRKKVEAEAKKARPPRQL
jgi:chromosome segregation ATPase